jgi:hypothetical protein
MERNAAGGEFNKPMNCWQYMSCGREPGGVHADRFGVCPASTDDRLDGVHGGKNAGRACWVVEGSFTKEATRGRREGGERPLIRVHQDCRKCVFYNAVHFEEGRYIWPTPFLQKLLAAKKKQI